MSVRFHFINLNLNIFHASLNFAVCLIIFLNNYRATPVDSHFVDHTKMLQKNFNEQKKYLHEKQKLHAVCAWICRESDPQIIYFFVGAFSAWITTRYIIWADYNCRVYTKKSKNLYMCKRVNHLWKFRLHSLSHFCVESLDKIVDEFLLPPPSPSLSLVLIKSFDDFEIKFCDEIFLRCRWWRWWWTGTCMLFWGQLLFGWLSRDVAVTFLIICRVVVLLSKLLGKPLCAMK